MTYIVYRCKSSNKILAYSIYKKLPENLDSLIEQYNNVKTDRFAHKSESQDIDSLIEISEKNKQLKESDIKSIERAFDNLQTEIYNLKEAFTL